MNPCAYSLRELQEVPVLGRELDVVPVVLVFFFVPEVDRFRSAGIQRDARLLVVEMQAVLVRVRIVFWMRSSGFNGGLFEAL